MLQIKDLLMAFEGGSLGRSVAPCPPWLLERYDSKRVSGWGSVNDMKGKDLEEVNDAMELKEVMKDKWTAQRGVRSAGKAGWSLALSDRVGTSPKWSGQVQAEAKDGGRGSV